MTGQLDLLKDSILKASGQVEDNSKAASFRLKRDFDIIMRMMEETKSEIEAAMNELNTNLPVLDLSDLDTAIGAIAERQSTLARLTTRVRELVSDIESLKASVRHLVALCGANSHLLHEHVFAAQRAMRDRCRSFKKAVDSDTAAIGKLMFQVPWTRQNYAKGMLDVKLDDVSVACELDGYDQVNNDTQMTSCNSQNTLTNALPRFGSTIATSTRKCPLFDKRRLKKWQPPLASIDEDDIPSCRQSMVSLKSKLSSTVSLFKLTSINQKVKNDL